MANILDGKKVAAVLGEHVRADVERLAAKHVTPTLAIVRVGERGDDVAYERGAIRRCEALGLAVKCFPLAADASQHELVERIHTINGDAGIHGCLLLRPFPKHMDDNAVRNALSAAKDVDGVTDSSLAYVMAGAGTGFAPCTARACMEILETYGIDPAGKRAVVVGRSLVVGKPAAMMLLQKNATVTVCHTKTADLPAVCREADILLVAAGRAAVVGRDFVRAGQIVLDVGVNVAADGSMCGDVDFAAVEPVVEAVTPVPGGVGAVTTTVLAQHVAEAALRMEEQS